MIPEEDEAFGEGGSAGVLAGLFPGFFGPEDGCGSTGEQAGWIVGGEDRLAGCVAFGPRAGSPCPGSFLPL